MILYVLDQNFKTVEVIDSLISLIWTDKYDEAGEVEVETSAIGRYWNAFQPNYYLWLKESEHLMIIEDREITTDYEKGITIKVTGRSLESILERRIVWGQTIFKNKSVKDIISDLLKQSIISPSDSQRKIPNFILGEFQNGSQGAMMTKVDAQYTGDDLYTVIKTLCQACGIGFSIVLNDQNQFVFNLYEGEDHTYNQFKNPYIVFSPTQNNITSTDYLDSEKTKRTVALVLGEGEGAERKAWTTQADSENAPVGLLRRELYVDARDISTQTEEGEVISEDEYNQMLDTRGKEKLAENIATTAFDGQVDALVTYEYKKDYFLGDIVQVVNELGMELNLRVKEYIYSQDVNGITYYPSFATYDGSKTI